MQNSRLVPEMSRSERADMSKRLKDIQRDMLKSFPDGTWIYKDAPRAASATADAVKRGDSAIYGAVFALPKARCRCDVIVLKNGAYDIYAVRPSDRYARWIDEVLYDKVIMEKSGVKTGRAYVCVIDRKAEGRDILRVVSADNEKREAAIREKISLSEKLFSAKKEPAPELKSRCGACKYFPYCFECEGDSIFSLKSLQFPKKAELYRLGIRTISSLLDSKLADEKTLREIKVRKSDEDVYDREKISEFLNKLSYPLGFLDFETMEVFIPNDKAILPMDTVITQFSYHLIEKKGGEAKHFDFIGDGVSYPERDAARELLRVIKPDHCVLMYSDYERVCIERLMKRLPEHEKALGKIRDRLIDLEKPFAKKYLVNRRMQGKSSLKSVLPALYPEDMSLDYKHMKIQNGRQAESVYSRLGKMNDAEREMAKRDLKDYCALDTLAMIKLVEKLYYYERKEE